ncbi:MAG TPA: polysaccharide deacetylase family protein [Terriglobia bacterium]|nr:polysaccharide deacetylase family protein [Terriglobia bacterium]
MINNSRPFPLAIGLVLVLATAGIAQYEKKPSSKTGHFLWPEGKRMALSLSFDDGRVSQVDVGIPLLDRYGVKATFFVHPSAVEKRLDGWKRAAASGHEIGNHSLSHPCTGNFTWSRSNALEEQTLDGMRRELTEANRQIEALLGTRPIAFAYPCGQTFVGRGREVKSYVPLVAEIFQVGRRWMDEGPNDPAFCDMAQVMGMPADNHEFAEIRPLIENAAKDGFWLVLAGHDIGRGDTPQTTQTTMLQALCRYAGDPANGVWLETVGTVSSYILKHR